MILRPLAFAIASLIAVPPLCAASDLRLTKVSGTVYLHTSDLNPYEWIEASENTPLESGDSVKTMDGASAEIALNADTVIALDEATEFKADTLEAKLTRFFLPLGSITAKIKSLVSKDEEFQIKTPVAVASVRGTELAVTSYGEEEATEVGVFDEGRVSVVTEAGTTELNAGQETEVRRGLPPPAPRPLQKFQERRRHMQLVRQRAQEIPRRWHALPPQRRQEMRRQLLNQPRQLPRQQMPKQPPQQQQNRRQHQQPQQQLQRPAPQNRPQQKQQQAPRRERQRQ